MDSRSNAVRREEAPRPRLPRGVTSETIRTAWRQQATWTVLDVCALLGLTEGTIRRHCRAEVFPGAYQVLVRCRREWRIPWAAVTAYQVAQVEATRRRILRQRAAHAARLQARASSLPKQAVTSERVEGSDSVSAGSGDASLPGSRSRGAR